MDKCWHLLCLWSAWHLQAAAFNLDTDHVLRKSGEPRSLFGFSVAFHQQLNPTRKNLLLVGAPRAKLHNQVNPTGAVYQCDLSTTTENCQPIEFNQEDFEGSRGVPDQWMGVRVTSQGPGKNVMMCAHKYRQWHGDDNVPNLLTGQCYLLGDNLKVGAEERTWRRVVCDLKHLSNRQRNQDWFAFCQQGHGASFAKDGKSLLFGAPGAYQWTGIVQMDPLDNNKFDDEVRARETGDNDRFEVKLIPLQKNSYLGFSIDSGLALLRQGELTIVSGAPRGGYSGQVTFLSEDPEAIQNLSVELVLSGPSLASSFGYDVAVVDFNNDGWEDLAVGAPQFYEKDGLTGGAVYIYINNGGKYWENIVPVRLNGNKESMFGLAVENIGDLNQDSYGDVAVGAPYDDSGKVYIYCGSQHGINRKPAQVLFPGPSSVVTLFGYSLSGNLDVDNNQYPDLAVGSLSDSVFIYRAKPVVRVDSSLTVSPNEIDFSRQRCDKVTCRFIAEACLSYTARPATFNAKLKFNFAFTADAKERKSRLSPRVVFEGSAQRTLELRTDNRRKCVDVQLRLESNIKDRLRDISVSVATSLLSSNQGTRTGAEAQLTPVLNIYQQNRTFSQIRFINPECSPENVCHSNLELQYRFCSRKKSQNNMDVYEPLAREGDIAIITPSKEDIALEITVTNRDGEPAHQAHVTIILPDTLGYTSAVHAGSERQSCKAKNNGSVIDCELGNPLQRDAQVTFYIILTTNHILPSTKAVNVTLLLKTTSEQHIQPVQALAKVVFELEMHVYGLAEPYQVSLEENLNHITRENAIKSTEGIGIPIKFQFRIENFGRSLKDFANASLNIMWPKENSVGKWLLYLTHVSNENKQSIHCSPASEVNPLKNLKGWHQSSRRRRQADAEAVSTGGFSILPTERKHKTLNCLDGLQCVEIHCPLLNLDSAAEVVLHSRLWNATFLEEYRSLNYLYIVVDATLSLINTPDNIGLKSEKLSTQIRMTVFLKRELEYNAKVAWWIIFLTVIALLLLLAVPVFYLWKVNQISL
ncbi:integrin alpha-6-like [Nelusetta ayraudi]|uniref:integrin alpha-6-like n=1 Tax=Nelusetta ayraudi TaxID=303726 RepID=UPI003F6F3668